VERSLTSEGPPSDISALAAERPPPGTIRGVEFAASGMALVAADDVPLAELQRLIRDLSRDETRSRFLIADAVIAAGKKYGDTYTWAAEASGRRPKTLRNWVCIARDINPDMRDPDLSWSVYRVVADAGLVPSQRRWFLSIAKENGWSAEALDRCIKGPPEQRDPDLSPDHECPECGHRWAGRCRPPAPSRLREAA
jgi:hypothetical protein